jgi:hypothetical protein
MGASMVKRPKTLGMSLYTVFFGCRVQVMAICERTINLHDMLYKLPKIS